MHTKRRTGQTGSAMIEMILAMPFLLFVMVFGMNLCKIYLAQQRAMVAVRYTAWAEVQNQPLPDSATISARFFRGGTAEVLPPESAMNVDEAAGMSGATSQAGDIFGGAISRALGSISGTQQYQVRYHYRAIFVGADYLGSGRHQLFPDVQITGSISVDSKDWRYPTPSFQSLTGRTVSEALTAIGWAVHHL